MSWSTYFAAMMGFNLAFSLYLQLGLGYSPLRLGTLFFDQPGFKAGIQVVLWACVGLLALTFVLSALLPRRAREEVSA